MSTIAIVLSIILLVVIILIIYQLYLHKAETEVEENLDKVTFKIREVRERLGEVKRKRPKSIKVDLNEKTRI